MEKKNVCQIGRNCFQHLVRYRAYLIHRNHRWARLLKQQRSITVYRLLTKENKLLFPFPFSLKIYWNGNIYIRISISTCISIYICISLYISIYLYIYATVSNRKRKKEAKAIFLNLLIVCSSCKWKFVFFPFVYEEIQ